MPAPHPRTTGASPAGAHGGTGPDRLSRYFALLMGVAFLLAGTAGFLPGFTSAPGPELPALAVSTSYGLLLGLYPINLVHNLIHLGFGVAGLLAFGGLVPARAFARVLAVTLAGFTVLGLVPALDTVFGVLPLFGHDTWLHAGEAALAGYVGLRRVPVAGVAP